MRLRIILIIVIAAFTSSFAQIKIGVKGGVNVNNVHNATQPGYPADPVSYSGFHAGLFAKFNVIKGFYIFPEIQYIRKGYRYERDPLNGIPGSSSIVNYIETTVITSFAPTKYFNIDLGPSLGIKVSASSHPPSGFIDFNELCNTVDFGLSAGLRFNLNERLSLIGRYYYGLAELFKDEYTDGSGTIRAPVSYHRNFQFSLAYSMK